MDDGNDGDGNDGDDKKDDEERDNNDEVMEDQRNISSILTKRKRSSESTTSGTTSSKHTKYAFTEEVISATMTSLQDILNLPDSSSATTTSESISQPPETTQITLPITTATITTEATSITTTTTPSATTVPTTTSPSVTEVPTTSSPPVSATLSLLSSDSTSGSPHSEETKEERIAKKIIARQNEEREMILKIHAEAEAKEEEQRKKWLKEQSDADREYLLKLSGDEAIEREREMRMRKEQIEFDAVFAKITEEIEKSEIQREKEAKAAIKISKEKGGAKSSVDRLWSEIDRKKYAARMIGRSNPAPITKVYLKKLKNNSQPQLLIVRGLESQTINLDQVCKLHREEWNEIRLAVSHSSSAAKKEVLKEIDRLFQKMVELQLLRPEDTVIFGEEIVQPPSPRYRSGTSSIYRIPNTSKLNLSIPADVPKSEGFEAVERERGLVYRDLSGVLRFQREAELEKIDHEQLVHLIRSASMLDKNSHMRKAILEEALARKFRYLPSTDKYELADELGIVKQEEIFRDS